MNKQKKVDFKLTILLDWWGKTDKEIMLEALGDENRTSVAEVLRALNKWCVGADTIW